MRCSLEGTGAEPLIDLNVLLPFLIAADLTAWTGERLIAACEARAYYRPLVVAVAPPMPSIPPMPVAGQPRQRPPGDMRLPEGGTNTASYKEYVRRQERALEFNVRRNQ